MSAPPPYKPADGQWSYQTGQPVVITNEPAPAYVPSYQGGAPPVYQTTPIIAAPTTYVYVRGNCPACHMGNLQDEFTPLGICLAICFFPLGLLCCLLLTEKRCNHCGMTYA